jgi:hypothetical protein
MECSFNAPDTKESIRAGRPKKEKLRTGTYVHQKSSRTIGTIAMAVRLEPLGKGRKWGCRNGKSGRTNRLAGGLRSTGQAIPAMTQQWDSTVSNEEKPTEKARAIRARQRAIGRELRRMYDDVAQEPVPDDFMDLLKQIDEANEGKKVS